MRAEARALGNHLLAHHRIVTTTFPPGQKVIVDKYTIRYNKLCTAAGVPHVLQVVGNFLGEVAEWCAANGYPPLNALAVNDTRMPGDGYDGAGGFKLLHWPTQVEECIRFKRYPLLIP